MARFTLLSLASPAAEISSCPTVSCGSFPVHTGSTSEFRTVFLMSLLLIRTLLLLFSLVLGQESKCAADRFPRPPGHRGFSVPLGLPRGSQGLPACPRSPALLSALRSWVLPRGRQHFQGKLTPPGLALPLRFPSSFLELSPRGALWLFPLCLFVPPKRGQAGWVKGAHNCPHPLGWRVGGGNPRTRGEASRSCLQHPGWGAPPSRPPREQD